MYALSRDRTGVYEFDGAKSWTHIGSIPFAAIYGGDIGLVGLAADGTLWYRGEGAWLALGYGVSEVAVSGRGVYALIENHEALVFWSATQNWVRVGTNIENLYRGPAGVAATSFGTHQVSWFVELYGGVWFHQGNPGYMFAVTGTQTAPSLFGLAPDRSFIAQSANVNAVDPSWSIVSSATGVLIGGGPLLYATGGIRYATQFL